MELATSVIVPLDDRWAFQLMAAPAGEPALGPVAFPHRASAASDPLAPLGHHWQDSTHISFGVATVGFMTKRVKLEASWFNGREPDEQRTDLDLRGFDSWSFRVQVNPSDRLSVQASHGLLESPEALEPGVSVKRTTMSGAYNRPFGHEGNLALTAVWGRNSPDEGPTTDSFLVESDVALDARNTVFGRAELVRKPGEDLVVDSGLEHEAFDVASLVVGYVHDFAPRRRVVPGLGFRVAANLVDDGLEAAYGDDVAFGGMVFFRLRPARMPAGHATQSPPPAPGASPHRH
jgi:hypothetical protein